MAPTGPPRGGRRAGPGVRHRIRYRFDNLLARGPAAALIWLGIVTGVAVLVSSLLLNAFGVGFAGSAEGSWQEDFWQSLLRVLDPGTMASDVGWGRRILALLVTIFGLLVAGTLIGIIASGVEDRIDRMRRGRSEVIETDHLVILGASSKLPVIIQQLVLAEAQRESRRIVVLSDGDPAELNRAVRDLVPHRHGTSIVYRSGDPTRRADLSLVRLADARGAIVVSDDDGSDTAAVQSVLAIAAELGGLERIPVVVEVAEAATALRLMNACGPTVHPIVPAEATARTAALSLRQRGLSQVLDELTDFIGPDLHLAERPELVGLPFEDLVCRFSHARAIGIARSDGRIDLNPPPDSVIDVGDRLIVVAADLASLDASSATAGRATPQRPGTRPRPVVEATEERILVVGWNPLAPHLLSGWAVSTAPTSTVEVAFDPRVTTPQEVLVPDIGLEVVLSPVEELSELGLQPLPTTIVLLGYRQLDRTEADARTLLAVLELRRRSALSTDTAPQFVVELLDTDSTPLVDLTGPDDFLISAGIVSRFIAQLVEQPERRAVLLGLYSGDGPSIHLVRCDELGLVGDHSVADVVASTYGAGLLAIGWRRSVASGGELVLAPDTSSRLDLAPDDQIVVVG